MPPPAAELSKAPEPDVCLQPSSFPAQDSNVFVRLLNRFPAKQFFFNESATSLHVPGVLDLYSGNCGVAKQLVKHGAPWVLTFDWKRGSDEDLLNQKVKDDLLEFAELGAFAAFGMAPICASMSRAITPPVRSRRWPRGIPDMPGSMIQKVKDGNSHAQFCLAIITIAISHGWAYWCENPDKSFLWMQDGWQEYLLPSSQSLFRLSYCRFGTGWRKDTRVATDTILAGLRMMCKCGSRKHQQLRGYSVLHGKSWTSVAEPYPRGFAKLLAIALAIKAGWCSRTRLNIAGCARAKSLRVGEATNPGPSRRFVPRQSLQELPTMSAATLALESKILNAFLAWCRTDITGIACHELFDLAPTVLVYLLRVFGDLMFQQRKALSNYRHLLLAAQRWKPMSRPFMQPAWELVNRWENQEPVTHRVPIPEPLVRAMIVTAWLHGWYAWAAATLIAFYGGGRLGEILQCRREDLLLPIDFIEQGPAPVFLRLAKFKSRMRQPARVQHLRIVDVTACKILHLLMRKLPTETFLFASSPYQYRRRWDIILRTLDLPASVKLTPGGLRGGFAVWAYRAGRPVQDIMWSLRLRSQTTLESYLQEAAALNCFAGLPYNVRKDIMLVSEMFPCLPAATP